MFLNAMEMDTNVTSKIQTAQSFPEIITFIPQWCNTVDKIWHTTGYIPKHHKPRFLGYSTQHFSGFVHKPFCYTYNVPRFPLFDSITPSRNKMVDLLSTFTANCFLVTPRLSRLLKARAMDVPMMNVNLATGTPQIWSNQHLCMFVGWYVMFSPQFVSVCYYT